MAIYNGLILLAQAIVYFTVMMGLLRARRMIGLGAFMCALGVLHFLETYLGSFFYVQVPFGVVTPGSVVFFAGKLLMILLLYIREDAMVARQPIYGLFIGNLLVVSLVLLLGLHVTTPLAGERVPDMDFIDEMGWLMVWGTTLLFIDGIAIIVLYERLGNWFGRHLGWRFLVSGAVVLTFDQFGFFLALHFLLGAPWDVFWSGWIGKMIATGVYTGLFIIYLRFFGHESQWLTNRSFKDVYAVLTYRERYKDLLETANRDPLTGVYHRRRYEEIAAQLLQENLGHGRPVSMMMIDIDNFKAVNDRLGHQAGDTVLISVAQLLESNLRSDDHLFRFGGEEFVLMSERLPVDGGISLAERLRKSILRHSEKHLSEPITVSIGVACAPEDGETLHALFKRADERLYRAKDLGRNRVCGPEVNVE
ncbi:GGDEF domain-containing protein [Roseibium denhamense]|uniref:diguanylate cyclase n=1 Tax=Roseibium denhamense TaxID=76305 RepID=A0ABY1N9R6_9HYPH|nr:GGDEF domain-containing protein [Roseibium denhamense]MTI05689.1 GGDEF domain-containing protein [Roseibium denhamense]SMP04238.1 diguanylate cyclase (GGDEF) domain-containing protein [Roseibium denhamense]